MKFKFSLNRSMTMTDDLGAPWNFSWVIKDELCACSWPKTWENVLFLIKQGVGHIVTLSEERKPHPIPPDSQHSHIKYYTIPVEEFEPPSMDQIVTFIDICKQARDEKKAVCVHCRMGRGRTGVLLACYLVKFFNQSPWAAVVNVRRMRPGSVETHEQERVVKEFWDYLAWG